MSVRQTQPRNPKPKSTPQPRSGSVQSRSRTVQPGSGSRRIAIAGLGDMGMPMAANLLRAGFSVAGYDPRESRRKALAKIGGIDSPTCRDAARGAEAAFVMVMNGAQMEDAVLAKDGLLAGLRSGAALFITATVERDDVVRLAPQVAKRGVVLIDSPVSGGQHGAVAGKLTFMAAGKRGDIGKRSDILNALGASVHIVGDNPGDGQTVKAVVQNMIGSVFAAAFESLAFGAKAGVDLRALVNVLNSSSAASPLFANCAELILQRKFKGTGSGIATMHKDLGIAAGLARRVGAPVFVASAARELFQAGATKFPGEDNWAVVKVLEEVTGAKVRERGKSGKSGKRGGRR